MTKVYKVEIALPVFYKNINIIEYSARKLLNHVNNIKGPYTFEITFSINGPYAANLASLVEEICIKNPKVSFIVSKKSGKGQGVLYAWDNSAADILIYMDIDMSTSLLSFERLILSIINGADLCIGSRYHKYSLLNRTRTRYILSRLYHIIIINKFLNLPIKDVQCGFKAISRDVYKEIRPNLNSFDFFFDAELVYMCYLAEKNIIELPVTWTESKVSSVKLIRTSFSFIANAIILKMRSMNKKKG